MLCVQWKTPDDGQRNCPKHAEFYSKNKFEKLLHLVGFIIRINISIFGFMSSTCFELEGSSSGRRLYMQLWYGMVPFTFWTAYIDA